MDKRRWKGGRRIRKKKRENWEHATDENTKPTMTWRYGQNSSEWQNYSVGAYYCCVIGVGPVYVCTFLYHGFENENATTSGDFRKRKRDMCRLSVTEEIIQGY